MDFRQGGLTLANRRALHDREEWQNPNYAMNNTEIRNLQGRVDQQLQRRRIRPTPPTPPYSRQELDQDEIDINHRCTITLDFPCGRNSAPVFIPSNDDGIADKVFG